jgi:murein DD-endopeptidase MepM/ murein hydrolase activator NlpD
MRKTIGGLLLLVACGILLGVASYRPAAPPAPQRAAPAPRAVVAQPRITWAAPTVGELSSGFGEREGGEMHKGTDIANSIGTPVRAASDGTVIASGPASGYGLWVKIQHADDVVTTYGHIDSSLVEMGQKVSVGQQVAVLGNRGESTGPHLHFQLEVGGKPVDPMAFYRDKGARLIG